MAGSWHGSWKVEEEDWGQIALGLESHGEKLEFIGHGKYPSEG